jgi:hypothetical protein
MHTAVCDPARSSGCGEPRARRPVRDARPRARAPYPSGTRAVRRPGGAATRPRRGGAGVLALLVVVAVAVLAVGRVTVGADVVEPRAVVVVQENETLWELVEPHVPPGTDRAVYAALVAEANDLDPLRLPPGTVVRLP